MNQIGNKSEKALSFHLEIGLRGNEAAAYPLPVVTYEFVSLKRTTAPLAPRRYPQQKSIPGGITPSSAEHTGRAAES
jgi:hypothetical protein